MGQLAKVLQPVDRRASMKTKSEILRESQKASNLEQQMVLQLEVLLDIRETLIEISNSAAYDEEL